MFDRINHIDPEQEISQEGNNLDMTERLVSAAVAGALIYSLISGPSRLTRLGIASFLLYRAATGNCPAYSLINKRMATHPKNVNIRSSVIVDRPRKEIYAFWRQFENLPKFMSHLVRVIQVDATRSTWEATLPGLPKNIVWDATIVKDDENSFIGWESTPGSDVHTAGKVEFTDAGDGRTEIYTVITYRAPAGIAGEKIARWLNPAFERLVSNDLNNFRKFIENDVHAHA